MRLLPSPRFILGANLPWVGYGTDIGASAWYPAGGLSSQLASQELLDGTFATLACDGITLIVRCVEVEGRPSSHIPESNAPQLTNA
jgi:hypothetical protein